MLSICHVPGSCPHKRLSVTKQEWGHDCPHFTTTHFTDKETEVQGNTTRSQADFSDSVSLTVKKGLVFALYCLFCHQRDNGRAAS